MATIEDTFDPRRNALNAVRLVLAIGVVAFHSFPLTAGDSGAPLGSLSVGTLCVDAFFAISGFLIVSSWERRPHAVSFACARFLRIMPAVWVCLIVTAFVIAPLTVWISDQGHYRLSDAISYVESGWTLQITAYSIGDTLGGNPFPNNWDGSLWTLWFEAFCYGGVLVLGVTRLLKRRTIGIGLFAFWLTALVMTVIGRPESIYLTQGPRLFLMFAAGAMLYQWRDRVPLSWPLISAAAVAFGVSTLLPDYRLIGALPLAYVCLGVGSICKWPTIHTDLSYGIYIYAFCVQQMLAAIGFSRVGPLPFFLLALTCTLPLAAGSWFLIERPALKLKRVVDRIGDRRVDTLIRR